MQDVRSALVSAVVPENQYDIGAIGERRRAPHVRPGVDFSCRCSAPKKLMIDGRVAGLPSSGLPEFGARIGVRRISGTVTVCVVGE